MSERTGRPRRYTRGLECPICGGSEDDERGSGVRCYGFISGDGSYAHCTREELGGQAQFFNNSNTFAHRLKGPCKCGTEHNPADPKPERAKRKSRSNRSVVAKYDYRDEGGAILFQVLRYDDKTFSQQRATEFNDVFKSGIEGVRRVLYRLPELVASDPSEPVFLAEGEKDTDALRSKGVVAACNPMGAGKAGGKWLPGYSTSLAGRTVWIVFDNDDDGRKHAATVAKALSWAQCQVKVIDLAELCVRSGVGKLAEKGDVSDFFGMGGTIEQLVSACLAAPIFMAERAEEAGKRKDYRATGTEGQAATGRQAGPHGFNVFDGSDDGAESDAEEARPRYNLTDLGNAERIVARCGRDLRYCHPWKRWLVWDGRRWQVDNTGAARRKARNTVRSIYVEAKNANNSDLRKSIARWGMESEKRDRISAMLTLAEAEDSIPVLPEQLDLDPWVFNCRNGTIDLKTGNLKAHQRADLLTKICPINYDPAATCEMWESTLDLFFAGNAELIGYFQAMCGYAITGVVRDHLMPVAYGKGSNGKSTMLGTLLEVFGPDYAMKCPPDMLMAKKTDTHPTDRADLFGKRLVVAIESEEGRRLNETMVKELTGGDKIRARRMREDFWEFNPTHTLFLATNYKPKIRGTDEGIWRRLRLIPFGVKVEGKARDLEMPEKLRREYPGILAWAVRGCIRWQKEGLIEPGVVTKASSDYRKEQDVLGVFLDDCCVENPLLRIKAGDLFSRYQRWCEANNEYAISGTAFGLAIESRGIEKKRSNGWWYIGLQTKDSNESRVEGDL